MTLPKPRLSFHKTLCVMSQAQSIRRRSFVSPFRLGSASTAKVSDIRQKTAGLNQNVRSVVRAIRIRDAREKEAKQPKCANCSGSHVASYKGCPEYKKQAFLQHVVNHQKTYAAVVGQKSLTQPNNSQTFQFTAEQLTKFVANVVIQIAQPQVCYPNPKQDMLDLKSSICRKVSNVAKTVLGVSITGKELFESIGSLSAPAPPKPFSFTSTKVNSVSKSTPKPPILKSTSPSSNTTNAVPKQPKATK